MAETYVCTHCGYRHPREELFSFQNELLCENCLDENTIVCERCGERIWVDDDAGDSSISLCRDCYDEHYTTCVECGRVMPYSDAYYEHEEDEENPRCYCCFQQRHQPDIHDYYYKPDPIFYGIGPRFMGVELEIDLAGEYDSNARRLLDIANDGDDSEGRLYCKHDGSLDEGFELVTHPMSLQYHQDQMPWPEILHEAAAMGYRSHQANTCGLHVHVSRDAFGETEEEQDAVIARILYFFEKHWEELLKFSRRTASQLRRWADRYGYQSQPKAILDHAKKGCASRYSCVNLQNTATIEFRIFRGTLKWNTLIATLQLVDRICDVALFSSDEEMQELSWTSFVAGCTQPELIQYLKERRLYINEPVRGEEEI